MSWCFYSYYLLCLPWLLRIKLNTCHIGWNYLTQNISHCICQNQFPAVLVGTNSLCFVFPLYWLELISRLLLYWVEFFCAKYFPLYWLEPVTRHMGWNQFPVVLLFPLYWLEPISCCIDWNQCPAVLVGTVSRKICISVLVEINFPPYWLEPIPFLFSFPRCICFPPY